MLVHFPGWLEEVFNTDARFPTNIHNVVIGKKGCHMYIITHMYICVCRVCQCWFPVVHGPPKVEQRERCFASGSRATMQHVFADVHKLESTQDSHAKQLGHGYMLVSRLCMCWIGRSWLQEHFWQHGSGIRRTSRRRAKSSQEASLATSCTV